MADLDLTTGLPNTYPIDRVGASNNANPDKKGKNPENSKFDKNKKKKLIQTSKVKDQVSTANKQVNMNDKKGTTKESEPLDKGQIVDITI